MMHSTQEMQNRRIFISGGAGFIGSHLVDRLIGAGAHVTVYDNFSSGDRARLRQHANEPALTVVEGDLLDSVRLQASMAGHDLVWHLGANGDIPAALQQTDLDLRNGLLATLNVLEAMRGANVRELVFSSSGSVYGEIDADVSEHAGPLQPISLYAASKLSSEAFISAYCHLFDLRAWIFRFGNVVGARMTRGVIHDLVHKALRNPAELEVLGNGRQEKPYILVEDCIDGMLYAYSALRLTADHPCEVLNLGTDTTTTVTSIANIVLDALDQPETRIRYTGGARGWAGDQPRVHLVTDKMRALGWEASHTSDGAVRTAARRIVAEARARSSRPRLAAA